MARTEIIDELFVTLRVPIGLPEDQVERVCRTLNGRRFMNRLRQAIRTVISAERELPVLLVSVTR